MNVISLNINSASASRLRDETYREVASISIAWGNKLLRPVKRPSLVCTHLDGCVRDAGMMTTLGRERDGSIGGSLLRVQMRGKDMHLSAARGREER